MEMASKTWGEEYWKKTGGGSAWDAITYDPVLNLVYIGVDGPSPMSPLARGKRRGDELFTNSIVALNADTGAYVWHYQTTPNDAWNYAATMHIMVADLVIQGKKRRVVMEAPKNGFYYVLNAKTGKLLSAKNIVPVNWASHIDIKTGRPVEKDDAKYWLKGDKGAIVYPSPLGAHNWMPMSYSPKTGLVYIPTMQMPALMKATQHNLVGGIEIDFYYALNNKLPFKGSLLAWDPIRQRARWQHDVGLPYNGGVLSTAGNLVFQGTTNGDFIAYRADTGEKIWSYKTGASILAAPSTVMVDGKQFILVPVGSGTTSAVGFASRLSGNPGGPARLLAFRLDGKSVLPESHAVSEVFPKPPLPRPDGASVKRGQYVWDTNGCELCHGFKAIGGLGSVPDLRKATATTHDLFAGIVMGGLYKEKGMPVFADMTIDDLAALQDYVLDEAWRAYDAQQTTPPK
jgi:quinohemoprotein ethanol dehydrogenase